MKRNIMRRRAGLIIAALVAATTALAGCSSSAASSGDATRGSITWWGWSGSQQYVDAFNKVYPHIKVTFKNIAYASYSAALKPALVSGSGPDVFELQPGAITTLYGRFAIDLTPALEKQLGSDWKSKIADTGVSSLTQDGQLKGISVGAGFAGGLSINADLFKKYDVTIPKTLPEWESACQKFKAAGVTCLVQGAKDEWMNQDMIQAIADSVHPGMFRSAVEGKTKWTTPDMVQALTIWQRMFKDGIMQDGALGTAGYPDAFNSWLTGKSAMVLFGTWNLRESVAANLKQDIVAAGVTTPQTFSAIPADFPDVAGKGNPPVLFGDADYGLAVNKASKSQSAATTFATWLSTSKAAQQIIADNLGQIPNLKSVRPQLNGLVDSSVQSAPINAQLKQAVTATEHRQIANPDLVTALGNALASVATGQASPADAAKTLQQASTTTQ